MKAAATKTASGMKATATVETTTAATVETTAPATVETAATATVETAATATVARLGHVCREPPTAPTMIPASAKICLHPALSIFSSTSIDGGWEGRQRQKLG
jgi:hypothetical protein